MSWILKPEGDRPKRRRPDNLKGIPKDAEGKPLPQTPGSIPSSPWAEFPLKDQYPTVQDPADPSRQVSTKQANRPFLAYVCHTTSYDQPKSYP